MAKLSKSKKLVQKEKECINGMLLANRTAHEIAIFLGREDDVIESYIEDCKQNDMIIELAEEQVDVVETDTIETDTPPATAQAANLFARSTKGGSQDRGVTIMTEAASSRNTNQPSTKNTGKRLRNSIHKIK